VRHSWEIDSICSSNITRSGTGNGLNDRIRNSSSNDTSLDSNKKNYIKLAIPDTSFLVYYHWKSYYLYYAEYANTVYNDTIIVKMDDDAVYIDVDNFENFIR